MLQVAGSQGRREKMAKSVGNIAPLHEVLAEHGRDTLIMYFCGGHYRQPIAFGDAPLRQAAANVDTVREAGRRLSGGPSPPDMAGLREAFFRALADDFNTAEALASRFGWVREANRRDPPPGHADLREMLAVLGLENVLEERLPRAPSEVVALAARRLQARERGDFAAADALRDEIAALGWQVRDVHDSFELLPK
jgi:cysteinyl-tRNA synthetase